MLLSDGVTNLVRRELRKLFPELKVTPEQVSELLYNDVLKREVIEGDKVKEASQRIKRAVAKLAKATEREKSNSPMDTAPPSGE
jgi:hypothetical protein